MISKADVPYYFNRQGVDILQIHREEGAPPATLKITKLEGFFDRLPFVRK